MLRFRNGALVGAAFGCHPFQDYFGIVVENVHFRHSIHIFEESILTVKKRIHYEIEVFVVIHADRPCDGILVAGL
jgi:hypothetical protein